MKDEIASDLATTTARASVATQERRLDHGRNGVRYGYDTGYLAKHLRLATAALAPGVERVEIIPPPGRLDPGELGDRFEKIKAGLIEACAVLADVSLIWDRARVRAAMDRTMRRMVRIERWR
jgi:hypothetical protein